MAYELDLRKSIQAVLGESDVLAAMAETVAGIDADFVTRHVLNREPEIAGQMSSLLQQYAEAEAQLASHEQKLEQLTDDPWYSYVLALAAVLTPFGGVIAFFVWLSGMDLLAFFRAATDFRAPNVANIVTGSVLLLVIGSGIAQINWAFRRRPALVRAIADDAQRANLAAEVAARRDALNKLGNELVRRNVFEVVNSGKAPFFQNELLFEDSRRPGLRRRITSGSGLSEVADKHHEAPTAMRREIVDLLGSLPGASVGISGARGSGKSTLLRSLCSANFPLRGRQAIAIYTAAPVDYEPRDFLLHLFITLCRQVIKTHAPGMEVDELTTPVTVQPGSTVLKDFVSDRFTGRILFGAGVSATLLAILLSAVSFMAAQTNERVGGLAVKSFNFGSGTLYAFGLALMLIGAIIWLVSSRDRPELRKSGFGRFAQALGRMIAGPVERVIVEPPATAEETLAKASLERLRNLKFQRTFTAGWSGALKAPVGIELSVTGSNAMAQRQESYPELVHSFRDYVAEVVAIDGFVVIAIDELDKMKTAEEAEEFVNDVKSIFSIPSCFFLISVSEDALSAFERRGLALRDAFDSAFDDIRYLGHLDLDGSRRLLFRRFLNLPDPFLCLCHVLSGGLPRDLIRLARAMLQAAQTGPADLRSVTLKLVRAEIAAKTRASMTAVRALAADAKAVDFLVALASLESAPIGTAGFARHLKTVEQLSFIDDTVEQRRLNTIKNEFEAYLQFLALAQKLLRRMQTLGGWDAMVRLGHVERVAQVRQGLEANAAVGRARHRLALAELAASAEFVMVAARTLAHTP